MLSLAALLWGLVLIGIGCLPARYDLDRWYRWSVGLTVAGILALAAFSG